MPWNRWSEPVASATRLNYRRLRGNAALCPFAASQGRSRPSSQAMGGAPRSGTASDTEQAACRRSNTIDLCYRILDMLTIIQEYA